MEPWCVSWMRDLPPVEAGRAYALTFRAKADLPRFASVAVGEGRPPWTAFETERLPLTNQWADYVVTFHAKAPVHWPVARFNVGGSTVPIEAADFSLQPTEWLIRVSGESPARLTLPSKSIDWYGVHMAAQSKGAAKIGDVQLQRSGLLVRKGKTGEIRFRARANPPRSAFAMLGRSRPPYDAVGLREDVKLESSWKEFRLQWSGDGDVDDCFFSLMMGGEPGLVEISAPQIAPSAQ
jgi:hypothetical protein